MLFKGQCHCGAIRVELTTDRQPSDQMLGACQCSFCRKHNARAFSDPGAHVTLTVADPQHLQRYSFGLKTSDQIICRRCGVYVAMTLSDGGPVWSVVNIDTLDDRALFTRTPEARDYTCDDANFCIRSLARDITGCSVKADARGMDIGITTVGPIDEARHRVQQRLA